MSPSFKYHLSTDQSSTFIGREDELSLPRYTSWKRKITGIPGIGKSELASQYCQRFVEEYDHFICINGQSIERSYLEIATILELHDITDINVVTKLLEEYFKDEKVLVFYNSTMSQMVIPSFFRVS